MKQAVLLVHGVNSRGEWFDGAWNALTPHFECVPFKYGGYRNVFAARALLWSHSSLVTKLADAWSTAEARATPPLHILAHSFGSYLTQRMLMTYPRIRAGTVVLVGSVAKDGPHWIEIGRRPGFRCLFNVVGGRDQVVRWVGLLPRKLREHFGDIGIRGFASTVPDLVHDLHTMWDCAGAHPCGAQLHNVFFPEFAHGHFLSEHELRYSVLPVLWGVSPVLYSRFLELCRAIWQAWKDERDAESQLRELASLKCSWCGGAPLWEHISARLTSVSDPELAADCAVAQLAWDVGAAHERRIRHGPNSEQRSLDPRIATERVIRRLLKVFT